MSARVVIHAGAPKTGSTYLQQRLRAGRERLRSHGVHVPVLPLVERMAGNAKLLATALAGEASPTFARAFPEIDVRSLDPTAIVRELLAEWRADRETVVLSAENFRPSHAARLRGLLPRDARCTVVLFVRRQDDWIESWHNQLVKSGEIRYGLHDFVEIICSGARSERLGYPDWSHHHAAWHDAFGSCRIVFYDEARDDVFAAFADAAELSIPPGFPDVPRAQLSLDAHGLAYFLSIDRPFEAADFARRRAAVAEASRRLGAPRARSVLSDADRAALRARFDASNRALLERVGRCPDDPVLAIGARGRDVVSLDDVYASPEFGTFRALADAIVVERDDPSASPQSV